MPDGSFILPVLVSFTKMSFVFPVFMLGFLAAIIFALIRR